MSEEQFIELALRYLDRTASREQVERLGAAMLDDPQRRATYRELAQQAQLSHEWHTINQASPAASHKTTRRQPPATLLYASGAAAALLLLGVLLLLRPWADSSEPPAVTDTGEPPPASPFPERVPSWSEIYPSPFDYPEFVWRAEIPAESDAIGSIDVFSDSGLPLELAEPTAEFTRLLAPIGLLPVGIYADRRL